MPSITISIDEDVKKILSKRANRNLFTLREQIEHILRTSAVRTKTTSSREIPCDDKLVGIFSRQKSGRKRKIKKKVKKKVKKK